MMMILQGVNNMGCEGCYRCIDYGCEAFTEPFETCWARQTDLMQYAKEQEDIIRYNKHKGNPVGMAMARKSIKRVMGAIG